MKKNIFKAGILVLWLIILSGPAAASSETEKGSKLAVRGTALLSVPADQVRLDIGVTTDARKADEALRLNSQKMDGILKSLEKIGLTDKEYQTSGFEIRPQWSPRPKNAEMEWRPHIVGYKVISRLSVKTLKLKLTGNLIEGATDAGANDIGSIRFDLSDPRKHRKQAIEAATENALADAGTLAKSAGVEIIRVLSLNLDHVQPIPRRMDYQRSGAMKVMAEGVAPPIVSGDVMVRATVDLVCEIREKK